MLCCQTSSVSCSLLAIHIYLPVFPALPWVASFPAVTYLVQDVKGIWSPQGKPTGGVVMTGVEICVPPPGPWSPAKSPWFSVSEDMGQSYGS